MTGRSCGERVASLVRKELDELRTQLALARTGRDRAVHKARKALQRLRAVILFFGAFDEELVARENDLMRKFRRRLAPLRDAAARSETFRLLATREQWKEFAPDLLALDAIESKRLAEAWTAHPPDADFWNAMEQARSKLVERAERWPYERADGDAISDALARAERRLRRRVRAARGETARSLRHEMRRKLRRYANLKRAAAEARHGDDKSIDPLLSLAKRCGHEGDLWLARASVRQVMHERPALKSLGSKLERARRAQCGRHDALLSKRGLD